MPDKATESATGSDVLVADSVAHHACQGPARGRRQVPAGVDPNSLAADNGAWDTRARTEDNIYQSPETGSGEAPPAAPARRNGEVRPARRLFIIIAGAPVR